MKNKRLLIKQIIVIASVSAFNLAIGNDLFTIDRIKPISQKINTRILNKAMDMPTILFEFNSVKLYKERSLDPNTPDHTLEDAVNKVYKIFMEESAAIIEIGGHCDSREANKDKLSLLRAKYIADELIKKGIPKKRIVVKGYGSKAPLIADEKINAAKTTEDKELLYLQNRRIGVRVLNWDYKK